MAGGYSLGILAIDEWTDVAEVAAMVDRCAGTRHVDGELDERIVGFYERLRSRFPDQPPLIDPDEDPWMDLPLDTGIDHVFVVLCSERRSDPALALIQELAAEYGLTIWDPQDGSAYRPVIPPAREEVEAWWRDLLDDRCGREGTHERVRPWVEETSEAIDDPITTMGVQQLYSLTMSDGTGAGELFERWLEHGERFDADPEGWERDRTIQAVLAIRRDQGPDRARALAIQLAARGSLTDEDVAGIIGPA
ncbi:hypothetical protein ACFQFC_06130 [Amorphoplanes digitatis]|uniref:Uncharacterized protein n=1 Tax=Actinoplanes digitatis TaxID=1868 RepID=A0A7W7HZW7_9ACTN|nr:hypothetical protein [Actinoplanes digitatis]MBB4763773.1 hypothetical protein [Actinoplanes digitatis]GID92968.1 hypothetical protein Adi01nite_23800 [Actinoplanes digitatis]